MKRYGSIYKITNNITGKVYIGQTVLDVNDRFYRHTITKKSVMYSVLKKYGKSNFKVEEIFIAFDEDTLNSIECYFIKRYNSTSKDFGYNITPGGKQIRLSPERVREKSIRQTGKRHTNNKPVKMTNISTGEIRIVKGLCYIDGSEFNARAIRSRMSKNTPTYKGWKFEYISKYTNQSGSAEIKNSEHAQRIGIEPERSEYNVPTSRRRPKYFCLENKDYIIDLYINKRIGSDRIAKILGVHRTTVIDNLKSWGVLRDKKDRYKVDRSMRYAKLSLK